MLASDEELYPATITSKTKKFFTVTYERTNGLKHEVLRSAQYTTHWRFLADSSEQKWLVETARVCCLAQALSFSILIKVSNQKRVYRTCL